MGQGELGKQVVGEEVIEPYYQDSAVTIYHGDCREILPHIGTVDAVLTDPPYGVGFKYESYKDSILAWHELIGDVLPVLRSKAYMVVLPSCQINQLAWIYAHHPPDWLICWYKGSPGHAAFIGFNDWEPLLVYGKTPGLQMHDYFYATPISENGHPCPKPLAWGTWLISRMGANTILDPFMGSGTTLRAAKDLGRKAIGIEIEGRYCEIAAKRMAQEVLPL